MSGAQTTSAFAFTDAAIEIRVNGGAWTPICGETSTLNISGGDRPVSEFFTACGDTPVVLTGKRSKIEIDMSIAYTEGLADAFAMVRQAYETHGSIFQVRWSPHGGHTDDWRYTTDENYSFVTSHPYPGGAVASADAIMFSCKVNTSKITWDQVP